MRAHPECFVEDVSNRVVGYPPTVTFGDRSGTSGCIPSLQIDEDLRVHTRFMQGILDLIDRIGVG